MITRDEVTATVKDVFHTTLKIEPDKLEHDTMLRDDLNLDSLDMIEVVYELEDRFDVQISEDAMIEIVTFEQVVDGLYAAIETKG